jgi:hypothetical protein
MFAADVQDTFIWEDVVIWVVGSTVDIYLYGILTTLVIDYIRNEWKASSPRSEGGQVHRQGGCYILYLWS